MADIKTRDAVKGTIKTIDKAAIASERMKSAYVEIKERAEQGYYADENSATEYAADRICCPCFLDCLSYRCKIEVKIIVSCVHKLTTLYLQNATIIFYRNVSSYRTI
jgi:hypothetical protein